MNHPPDQIQLCTLLNIKTGGCGEDCSYCAQSARYADKVGLKAEKLSEVEPVLVSVLSSDLYASLRVLSGVVEGIRNSPIKMNATDSIGQPQLQRSTQGESKRINSILHGSCMERSQRS